MTRARRASFAAAVLLPASLAAATVDPRTLPTAVELWRYDGPTDTLLASPDAVFVAGKGRVVALDPRDGTRQWSATIGSEQEDCGCGQGSIAQVDDRLFVPIGKAVATLDSDDGTLLARVELDGPVHRVAGGPPVVAQAEGDEHGTIVRLDERSGLEAARLVLPGGADPPEVFGDRVLVLHRPPEGDDDAGRAPNELLGLDESLQVTWREALGGDSYTLRDGDSLVVGNWNGDQVDRLRYDPATGASRPVKDDEMPRDDALRCGSGRDAIVLEPAEAPEEYVADQSKLRRAGPTPWTLTLPGNAADCLPWGSRLLVRGDRSNGRGVLAVVDARSGRVERVLYLPSGVQGMAATKSALLLERADGLIAIDPGAAGPAEADTQTLAQAVEEILARAEASDPRTLADEIEALGPEAPPLAVAALGRLGRDGVLVVGTVADDLALASAAAPLAAAVERLAVPRAAGPGEDAEMLAREADESAELVAVLLAPIAGPAQVPVLDRYADPAHTSSCLPALAALGRIGTRASLAAQAKRLARDTPGAAAATPWLARPTPPARVPTAEERRTPWNRQPVRSPQEQQAYFVAARSDEVVVPGGRVVVFPGDLLGGWSEAWIAEIPDPQAPAADADLAGGVHFLGDLGLCPQFQATVLHGNLRVGCTVPNLEGMSAENAAEAAAQFDAAARPLTFPFGAWRRDGDGDGLSDLLEARLGLDPRRADSDGDGIPDGLDRSPNARRPSSPEERALGDLMAGAVAAFAACSGAEENARPLFVAAGVAPEWHGRSGPTIAIAADELPAPDEGVAAGLVLRTGDLPPAESGTPESPVRKVETVDGSGNGVSALRLRKIGDAWRLVGIETDPVWAD